MKKEIPKSDNTDIDDSTSSYDLQRILSAEKRAKKKTARKTVKKK